ncbi:MAG: PaaI family thioesterase [Desulfobacterales bacterium]|nr:PaaI family thioesterase [Desulfobacterales bacterium]
MLHTVTAKQPNSKMCLVCGLKNPFGLHTSFFELDNNELLAVFKPRGEHQSYPGRLHGGIISTILDETIGRAIMIQSEGDIWGVTVDLQIRFKKPVPLDEELRVIGRITKDSSRFFEGTGELLLQDGTVAATGHGKYLKVPLEKIADFDVDHQEWQVVQSNDDPKSFQL